ncbi:MAG: hypothetical protein JST96_06560 [Bacteroidetes bacterium]|nr:hypothetical protein [Bacteroidota bacterium]
MKYILSISTLFVFALASCGHNANEQTKAKEMKTDSAVAAKKDFSKIQFASKLDYSCFMPLTAGVGDTAIIDGKVYGFCSKECKDEFMKNPAANIKAGEAHELSMKK